MQLVKNQKKSSLLIPAAVCVAVLLVSLIMAAGTATAAPAATVGVVDYDRLMTSHPDMPQANEALKAASEQANKELAAQAANLSDKEKQDLIAQLEQRVERKRQTLMIAIADKVNAAIKETGEAKGLKIVIQKNLVVYGGLDITDEVLKKITGK